MPGIDFDRLREEITMEQVLNLTGFERTGDQWYGRCPLPACLSRDGRRFSVNVSKRLYYCHGCQNKGNQIQLWAAHTGQTVRPAAIDLCAELGREVPWLGSN